VTRKTPLRGRKDDGLRMYVKNTYGLQQALASHAKTKWW
jgi:hypothetical protein